MNSLNKNERLRRVILLCCHFARNLAYHRTGHDRLVGGDYTQILATIDGNFLDMAVIEWCKLFGDNREKHYWQNVVSDRDFEVKLLAHIGQSAELFARYVKEIREYRDKFLAHLDNRHVMNIPNLDRAKAAVEFYHNYVVQNEASTGDLGGLPSELSEYYQQCVDEALKMLDRCNL